LFSFRNNTLHLNQLLHSEIQFDICTLITLILIATKKAESSAKITELQGQEILEGRSLMRTRNRNGQRTIPEALRLQYRNFRTYCCNRLSEYGLPDKTKKDLSQYHH
jgi:hypothetical protein